MQRSKRHFQQVPLEIVKKIAKELPETSAVRELDEITPPQEHWREVAKQVQQEQDPKRMTELVQQLLAELDERDLRRDSGSSGGNVLNRVSTQCSVRWQ
jgi:hypothetical protein